MFQLAMRGKNMDPDDYAKGWEEVEKRKEEATAAAKENKEKN